MSIEHAAHQRFESNWWGNCNNTWCEEWKQITYATKMGITICNPDGHYPAYVVPAESILDLGGGPTSMLLKTQNNNGSRRTVVDPCSYPEWVARRYQLQGIEYVIQNAEDYSRDPAVAKYDECWIYNVLQHTMDPAAIIRNARQNARLLRIFEWIEIPAHAGIRSDLPRKT